MSHSESVSRISHSESVSRISHSESVSRISHSESVSHISHSESVSRVSHWAVVEYFCMNAQDLLMYSGDKNLLFLYIKLMAVVA